MSIQYSVAPRLSTFFRFGVDNVEIIAARITVLVYPPIDGVSGIALP